MLKAEAKSYLVSTDRKEQLEQRESANPKLAEHEKAFVRKLASDEVKLFEKEVLLGICGFVEDLLAIEGMKDALSYMNTEYHVDLMQEGFVDVYDYELDNFHDKLMRSETAHYLLCFLFDSL